VLLIAFLYLWLKFWEGIDKYWIVPVRKVFYFHHCLDIKSLIDLKIFGATFGIGEGNCPHCPPWLRAWSCTTYSPLSCQFNAKSGAIDQVTLGD